MNYEEAVAFLDSPKYNMIRPGLDPMIHLMDLLGNPQDSLHIIHIAGTNGKGSTAAYISQILQCAGYKTGLYTSPYIERFTERIRCDDREISPQSLARLTTRVYEAVQRMAARKQLLPTAFELITAVAFLYYAEEHADFVVLETGLGGRLDATNIIPCPVLSVITAIDMDHMNLLGDTLAAIAGEKAGIIKTDGHVVSYEQRPEAAQVIQRRCQEQQASLDMVDLSRICIKKQTLKGQDFSYGTDDTYHVSLLGTYQVYNAATALTAARCLQRMGYAVSDQAVSEGLAKTRWPGRLERVGKNPLIFIDGAHNPHGVRALRQSLEQLFPQQKYTFIMGVLADKDYLSMIEIMRPLMRRVLTVTPASERALSGEKLAVLLRKNGVDARSLSSIAEAVDYCRKEFREEVICAFGSLYYIGQVRAYCLKSGDHNGT